MKRNVGLYLDDILKNINRIELSTRNITKEQFDNGIDIQDAVIRRIEVIGEAVKHLPQEFIKKHPNIPWKKIAGTRDVIIHDYFEVNLQRIWNIIQKDLMPLKKQIEDLLSNQN